MKAALITRAVRKLTGWQSVLFFRGGTPSQGADTRRQLRRVDAATAEKWKAPWQLPILQYRISEGAQLYAWIVEDRPVCYAWVSVRKSVYVAEVHALCEFPEPTVCIWDCVTPEEFRSRGYYAALLKALLFEYGAKTPIIYCSSQNMASRRGITKAGFAAVGAVVRTRLGINSFLSSETRIKVASKAPKNDMATRSHGPL